MKRLIVLTVMAVALTGCTHARHSECQDLASQADGAQIGAILGGSYAGQIQANIAQREYVRCENALSTIDYARGSTPRQQTSNNGSTITTTTSYQSTASGSPLNLPNAYIFKAGGEEFRVSPNNNLLSYDGQMYQLAKSKVDYTADEAEPSTGTDKGDVLSIYIYRKESDSTKEAFMADEWPAIATGYNSTKKQWRVIRIHVVNGKPDEATSKLMLAQRSEVGP